MRGFILGTIFLLSVGLILWLCSEIAYPVDAVSLFFGLVVAGLTGFTWMMLGNWWTSATRPFRPMTVTLQTRETPFQLGCAAIIAFLQTVAFVIAVIVGVILIIANIANP